MSLRLAAVSFVRYNTRRNLTLSAVALQQKASDPIQQLFVKKVREYATKKKASGGKLVDDTALTEAHLAAELDKVAKQYGGGKGIDMTKFSEFNWVEPQLDDIDLKIAEKN